MPMHWQEEGDYKEDLEDLLVNILETSIHD